MAVDLSWKYKDTTTRCFLLAPSMEIFNYKNSIYWITEVEVVCADYIKR